MYTNTAILTRSTRVVEVPSWEPIHTRPRVAPDGAEVRDRRPSRRATRQRVIAQAIGVLR